MDMVSLTVTARSEGTKAKVLRQSNCVPCVLYGNDTPNVSLQCVYNELFNAYRKAGASTIVDLDTGKNKVPVLFHAVQMDPVSDRITHVDFYAVDMKKEIEASIPLQYEGEAPAVKELGGVLVTAHDHVTVKCLPTNLPHHLSISLEPLEEFHSSLTVADIVVPEGVQIMDDLEVVVANVQEPRKEEVIEEVPEEGEEGEGEEGAEGEEKTEGEGGEASGDGGGDGGDSGSDS
tara:strand:- start:307 stop:1005 length:699 start_codon:yes stop_codon:yes gene_type:complete